jgi:energy-converting hydrogenase Eha subunit E
MSLATHHLVPSAATFDKPSRGSEPTIKDQHRPLLRIYLPADFHSDDGLPLPAVAPRARPRLFYVFRADFHRACARNIAPPELMLFAFLALAGTLGIAAALSRSLAALRIHTDVYSATEFALVLLAYSHALAFVYWVQRVAVEKIKASWQESRERRAVRLV